MVTDLDKLLELEPKAPQSLEEVNDKDIDQITDYYYSKYKSRRKKTSQPPVATDK